MIAGVTASLPDRFPILRIVDPNSSASVSGYHIRRNGDASAALGSWPLLGTNVVDMDAGTAGIQWTDSTGDVAPSGIWFYEATAYQESCPAEGPF